MENVKVVKGRPVYIFRGSQYFDKPDKTKIKRMQYSEEEGITYVYLKRVSNLYELVCVFLIISIITFNRLYTHEMKMSIKYNSLVNYYNGKLYVNITSDENNPYDIKYKIGEYSGVIKPGESIITLDIENPLDNYDIVFTYDTLLSSKSFTVHVSVINRDYN